MSDAKNAPDPAWKQLKLSLERPYKDDLGNAIPVLYDLTPEGERIYEPKKSSSSRLETNLRRIIIERGLDYFEKRENPSTTVEVPGTDEEKSPSDEVDDKPKPMTVEELYAMRMEIMPHLFVALGEMSQARDLLVALLSSAPGGQNQSSISTSTLLSATTVTKPPPIVSVQAFNAQLTVGGKDETLRKVSKLFKAAAESMGRSQAQGKKYWVDALRARRANWGLSPAPLPPGSATGKGADKTSKDFIISYGLEGSPAIFRQRAIAQLPTITNDSQKLTFPLHQNTRLRISTTLSNDSIVEKSIFTSPRSPDSRDPCSALENAQVEIVDQEIFSLLVKEAGNLPTASAQVAERLIIINPAQGLDLTFELIDSVDACQTSTMNAKTGENLSELIYHVLHVLLLRKHNTFREKSIGSSKSPENGPSILQPIVDTLQYQIFCGKTMFELRRAVDGLNFAGIPSTLSFVAIAESGQQLVSLLSANDNQRVGGEAVIRIDNRHTLRFTMLSPSTLAAHLSQATVAVSSLPQLSQLLMDEIDRCLLQKICTMGRDKCHVAGGIWFVDMDRCVARWEGCALNFQISFDSDFHIGCFAFRLDSSTNGEGVLSRYVSGDNTKPLFVWVKRFIESLS